MEIPCQRNHSEVNKIIKDESEDDLWNDHPINRQHKDIDTRCVKKNGDTRLQESHKS